jgi:hypothetical protein
VSLAPPGRKRRVICVEKSEYNSSALVVVTQPAVVENDAMGFMWCRSRHLGHSPLTVGVLINNAGISRGTSVLEADTSKLREGMWMGGDGAN